MIKISTHICKNCKAHTLVRDKFNHCELMPSGDIAIRIFCSGCCESMYEKIEPNELMHAMYKKIDNIETILKNKFMCLYCGSLHVFVAEYYETTIKGREVICKDCNCKMILLVNHKIGMYEIKPGDYYQQMEVKDEKNNTVNDFNNGAIDNESNSC